MALCLPRRPSENPPRASLVGCVVVLQQCARSGCSAEGALQDNLPRCSTRVVCSTSNFAPAWPPLWRLPIQDTPPSEQSGFLRICGVLALLPCDCGSCIPTFDRFCSSRKHVPEAFGKKRWGMSRTTTENVKRLKEQHAVFTSGHKLTQVNV